MVKCQYWRYLEGEEISEGRTEAFLKMERVPFKVALVFFSFFFFFLCRACCLALPVIHKLALSIGQHNMQLYSKV